MLATPLVSAVLALFALAASNDLSNLRVDASSGSGSGSTVTTATTIGRSTTSPTGGSVGTGTPGTGTAGAGALGPGGGIVPATTVDDGAAGLGGPSTTFAGAVGAIPADTGLDGSAPPATDPTGSTTADGATVTSAPGTSAPGTSATASTQADGSVAGGDTTVPGATGSASSATTASGSGAAQGDTTNSTTAVTPRPDRGSSGGLVATLRLVAIMIAFAAAFAGVAWLAGSIVRAILTGRRQRRDDDDDLDDDDLDALVLIDPASAGWTLEQLRRRLEAETDPRLAIREAYAVVESGFGIGGGLARRRTETALQYLERTLGMIDGGTKPLRVLTGLFLLARFSNRPMNEAMRRAAIDAVVELQARFRAAEKVAA